MFNLGERERLARSFRRLAEKYHGNGRAQSVLCEAHNTAGGAARTPRFFFVATRFMKRRQNLRALSRLRRWQSRMQPPTLISNESSESVASAGVHTLPVRRGSRKTRECRVRLSPLDRKFGRLHNRVGATL